MRNDAVVFVAAALAWAAFLYKLRHLRQRAMAPGASALRALVVVLGLLACVFTLLPQSIGVRIDGAAGLSGLTRLICNMLAMVTCLQILGWLLYLSRPERQARTRLVLHARILGVVLVAVVALFALDHPPVVPEREFDGAHTYLFLAYLAYVQFALVSLSMRYASMVEPPMMRLGLRLVSAAITLGLGFVAIQLIYLLEADVGLELYGSPTVIRPIYTTAALLFVVGMTLPAWGPWVGLEVLWWRVTRWHATYRLRPLWTVVTEACPGIVLDRAFLAASPYGERIAAERLPVEIHDGWLQLRSHLTWDDAKLVDQLARQRGIRNADTSAPVAAARLMVAIHRKSAADGPPPVSVPPVEFLGTGVSKTLVAEVRFLCGVSKNLRSRFVRDALAQVATVQTSAATAARACPDG